VEASNDAACDSSKPSMKLSGKSPWKRLTICRAIRASHRVSRPTSHQASRLASVDSPIDTSKPSGKPSSKHRAVRHTIWARTSGKKIPSRRKHSFQTRALLPDSPDAVDALLHSSLCKGVEGIKVATGKVEVEWRTVYGGVNG
jgi:hypothetical protein